MALTSQPFSINKKKTPKQKQTNQPTKQKETKKNPKNQKPSKETAFPWPTTLFLFTNVHLRLATIVRDKWLIYLNLYIRNNLYKITRELKSNLSSSLKTVCLGNLAKYGIYSPSVSIGSPIIY